MNNQTNIAYRKMNQDVLNGRRGKYDEKSTDN